MTYVILGLAIVAFTLSVNNDKKIKKLEQEIEELKNRMA